MRAPLRWLEAVRAGAVAVREPLHAGAAFAAWPTVCVAALLAALLLAGATDAVAATHTGTNTVATSATTVNSAAGNSGHAEAEPAYLHTTVRGDTLIGLGRRFLAEPQRWPELARANGVKVVNRIPAGGVLRIPLRLMALEPVPATVTAVNGEVRTAGPAGDAPVVVGQNLPPGSELRTGNGNTTVRLVDGTVLRLRAASRLQIEESSRVPQAGVVRSGVVLREGQVEVQARPAPAGQPGFRINTPQGVLGVRGTEFRVHADAPARVTRSEVLEGVVAANGAPQQPGQRVYAGFGVVVDSSGTVSLPVKLLPAPTLQQLPALQERPLVRFSLPALQGAVAYRAQVSADTGFERVLVEQQSPSTDLRLADLPDGDYVLRLRGVDTNGLQGQNADHRFRLKARPEPPLPQTPAPRAVITGDRVDLAWTANPEARSYRLQLSRSEDFSTLLRDLPGQHEATLPLQGLPPGTYYWRLASERSAADQGPFGATNQFELRLAPPPRVLPAAPAAPQVGVGDQAVQLAWEGAPGQTFEVQVARDPAFTALVLERAVTEPRLQWALQDSGRFYVRVRARDADGFFGPYSTPQRVDLPHCLRAVGGACVKALGAPVVTKP